MWVKQYFYMFTETQSLYYCFQIVGPTSHCGKTLTSVLSAVAGAPFTRVFALDQDDPQTPNSHLSYSLVSQIPNKHNVLLFQIDPNTGEISTTEEGNNAHACSHRHEPRHHRLGALSVGKSVICPSLPVIWRYSAAVNPDYTAHLARSRLTLIGGRLPKCVA